jgi:hypothetical protein
MFMKLQHYLVGSLLSLGLLLWVNSSFAGGSKISPDGKFLPFKGITVVADTAEADQELWKNVYEKLKNSPLIVKYYSLLPQKSYHMTTINIDTESEYLSRNPTDLWSAAISHSLEWFQNLSNHLQLKAFTPQAIPHGSRVFGAIMFTFDLDNQQKEKLNQVALDFQLLHRAVSEFHVTLAYGYHYISHEDLKQIESEVDQIFQDTMKSYEKPITFLEPKLRYFKDMTEFTSWDGKENPFLSQQ